MHSSTNHNKMDIREESILNENQVRELLSDVIHRKNIINPRFTITSGAAKGDGYTSFLMRVSIRGENNDVSVIIKCAPKNVQMREALLCRSLFSREIYLYDQVFPAFKKFQLERDLKDSFDAVPKYYKSVDADCNELIVMENLIESGFKLFDKSKQLDHAHVTLVLKEYGKYHAISFAMKEHSQEVFGRLRDNVKINTVHTKNLIPSRLNLFTEPADTLAGLFDKESEKDLHKCMLGFKDKIVPFFKTIDQYLGKYGVINHGDCWCNNMMFKYEDKNNPALPTSVRLLDFQLSSYNSPVLDLSYFFYISASKEMLDNLDGYLQVYHHSLTKNMKAMNTNVKNHFPFSALKEEWKSYSKYALMMSLFIFRVMLRAEDEVLDCTDSVNKDGVELADVLLNKSNNDSLIDNRYRVLIRHMYYNGFL